MGLNCVGLLYMLNFFSKCVLPLYMINGWLNLQMRILGIECKVTHRFLTVWKIAVFSPRLAQGLPVISTQPESSLIALPPSYVSSKYIFNKAIQTNDKIESRKKGKVNLPNTMHLASLMAQLVKNLPAMQETPV